MQNVFKHYTLQTYLAGLKEDRPVTFSELSKRIGLTPQAIGLVFNGHERLVINHIAAWKRALKFNRLQGSYFELLAIIAAFSTSTNRKRLQSRAQTIVRKLVEIDPTDSPVKSLIYWISPECSLLRNILDLKGFPVHEKEIPKWVTARTNLWRVTEGYSRKETEQQFRNAWKWLVSNGVVVRGTNGAWRKTTPIFLSPDTITEDIRSLQASILTLPHSNTHLAFARQLGTPNMLVNKVATFSASSKMQPILRDLCTNFLQDIAARLNIACNEQLMTELKTTDPDLYNAGKVLLEKLAYLGYDVPSFTNEDFDSVWQIVLGARRLTDPNDPNDNGGSNGSSAS